MNSSKFKSLPKNFPNMSSAACRAMWILTQTLYQAWLLSTAQQAGLLRSKSKTLNPKRINGPILPRIHITCPRDLEAVGGMVFTRFKSTTCYIVWKLFNLQTLRNSPLLDGALAITAVCVNSAPASTEMERPSTCKFSRLGRNFRTDFESQLF